MYTHTHSHSDTKRLRCTQVSTHSHSSRHKETATQTQRNKDKGTHTDTKKEIHTHTHTQKKTHAYTHCDRRHGPDSMQQIHHQRCDAQVARWRATQSSYARSAEAAHCDVELNSRKDGFVRYIIRRDVQRHSSSVEQSKCPCSCKREKSHKEHSTNVLTQSHWLIIMKECEQTHTHTVGLWLPGTTFTLKWLRLARLWFYITEFSSE